MDNLKKLQRRIVDRTHKTPTPGTLVEIAKLLNVKWEDLYEVIDMTEPGDIMTTRYYQAKELDFETNKE